MSPTPLTPGSTTPADMWNEAIREFLRARQGRQLSAEESAEYERLRDGYTRAMLGDAEAGTPPGPVEEQGNGKRSGPEAA